MFQPRSILLGLWLIVINLSSSANGLQDYTFDALYNVQLESLNLGQASMKLKALDEHLFELSISAETSGWIRLFYTDSLYEKALLTTIDGELRTQRYEYLHRRKKEIKEHRIIELDYEHRLATTKQGKSWPLPSEIISDRLSFAFLLAHYLRHQQAIPTTLGIVDGAELFQATIQKLANKTINNQTHHHYRITNEIGRIEVQLNAQKRFIPSFIRFSSEDSWSVTYRLESVRWTELEQSPS